MSKCRYYAICSVSLEFGIKEKSRKYEINSMYHKYSISIANVEALPDIDAALQLSHSATDKAGGYRVLSEERTKA